MSAFSHGFKHGFMHGMFNNMFGGGWCNPFMNGFGMGFNPFGGYCNPFNNFGFGCNPYMSWNPASLFIMPRYDYRCYIPYQSPSMPLPSVWDVSVPDFSATQAWSNLNYAMQDFTIPSFASPNSSGDTFVKTTVALTETTPKIKLETDSFKTEPKTEKIGEVEAKSTIEKEKNENSAVTIKKANTQKTLSNAIMSKHWSEMTDTELRNVYGDYTRDITQQYAGSVANLNKKLENRGVLKGRGQDFLDAQQKYGISAAVLVAICIQETGGISYNARVRNNVGNISKGKGWRSYKDTREGIFAVAKLLKENYVNKGLKSLYKVNAKYCPVQDTRGSAASQKAWASKVEQITSSIEKASV